MLVDKPKARSVLALAAILLLAAGREAGAHPDLSGTIEAADRRLASGPTAQGYLERAELQRLAGHFAQAALDLERAAALDASLPTLALCRAALAVDLGRGDEARAALAVYRVSNPDDARAWMLDARLARGDGRWREAANALGRAALLQASPSPDLYVERARLLGQAGDPGAGLSALEEGISRLGPLVSLELAAIDAMAERGDRRAALARLDRLALRLEAPWALFPRRAALLRAADEVEAARWVEAATAAAARTRGWMAPATAGPATASPPGGASDLLAAHPVADWLSTRRPPPTAPPASSASPIATSAPVSPVSPTRTTAIVTRGPYLGMAGPNRITVRWRTDVPTDSRVRFGLSYVSLSSTRDDPALTTEHEITLTGLVASVRYYYSVGTTTTPLAGGDAAYQFLTSPTPGSTKGSRLWVIGDSGTGNSVAMAVRDAFAAYAARPGSRETDLWLMLGDNAYNNGTDAEYQSAVFDMYPAMLRSKSLWPTRGNHDLLYAGAGNDYYDIFTLPTQGECGGVPSGTEAYYSFDYANIHFVCLDSEGSDRSVSGPMATWLRTDLAATARDWVIAFWHHPPYTKGSHDSDNEVDSGARMGEMRRNIVPILDSAGVDLVLTGHSHSYERSFLINGHYGTSSTLSPSMILDAGDGRWNGDGPYFKPTLGTGPHEGAVHTVAGASGQTSGGPLNHPIMVTSLNVAGSMVIDVTGSRLDARYLDTQGAIRDSFTIVKGSPLPVPVDPSPSGNSLEVLGPHPTHGPVHFAYRLPAQADARFMVLDSAGRPVRSVRSGVQVAGRHVVVWDGRDERGRECPAGVYFAVLDVGGQVTARKVVRLGS